MQFADKSLDMSYPHVMGVLNITPDSFSDGGRYHLDLDAAMRQAEVMVHQGVSLIDVGGESTRPGAAEVSEAEELGRVIPIIEGIRKSFDVIVSVDTSKPRVMFEAVLAGAGLINDVRALSLSGALDVAVCAGVPVCLMHMQGSPESMQISPGYDDVVMEVEGYLRERKQVCIDAGIKPCHILLDPGFGFGKTHKHNLDLMRGLGRLSCLGSPLLVGVSRKSMLGVITSKPVGQRLAGGLAAATYAALSGVTIIRTHDVDETVDALKFVRALKDEFV